MLRETRTERAVRLDRERYIQGFIEGWRSAEEYWREHGGVCLADQVAVSPGRLMFRGFDAWQEKLKPVRKAGV